MDPYSSPYITHYSSFHFLVHSFIPSYLSPPEGEEEGFDPMGFSLAFEIGWLREAGGGKDLAFGV